MKVQYFAIVVSNIIMNSLNSVKISIANSCPSSKISKTVKTHCQYSVKAHRTHFVTVM